MVVCIFWVVLGGGKYILGGGGFILGGGGQALGAM